MKKLFPVLVLAIVGGAAWFVFSNQPEGMEDVARLESQSAGAKSGDSTSAQSTNAGSVLSNQQGENAIGKVQGSNASSEADYEKDALELYKSADEALAAIDRGAISYDDVILDQFVEPGPGCPWCGELYSRILSSLKSGANLDEDKKSYYGEILAISGKKENIEALVNLVKESKGENAELYAEALEFTIGDDEVVNYLDKELATDNELLKESLIAAVTNQSSRYAAEVLYNQELATDDPNEYYDVGIGLGEFIPDEEALPFLQEKVIERNNRSHLAAKALLNYGRDGLQLVIDVLTNSDSPEFDQAMLEDAVDHVIYEEGMEEFLKETIAQSKTPIVVQFSKDVLQSFEEEGDLEEEDEES